MTVLDAGCGPGFFSIVMAEMVGPTGLVVASDLQQGMLQKVRQKTRGTSLDDRVLLHQCQSDKIGWTSSVDFVLAFYMLHEVPDQKVFFQEMKSILRPGGKLLLVEPPVHVTRRAFQESLLYACDVGFTAERGPKILFSKSRILC